MQPEQLPSLQERFTNNASLVAFIAQVFAVSVQPLLRTRLGERYLGIEAGLVLLLIPLYSVFWKGADTTWLYAYLGVFVIACIGAKSDARRRARRGDHEHSFYGGDSLLGRVWPFRRCREATLKGTVEPLVIASAGCAVMSANAPLGSYLLWSAVAMRMTQKLAEGYQRARMLDLRDAYLEQRQVANRFRDGDW